MPTTGGGACSAEPQTSIATTLSLACLATTLFPSGSSAGVIVTPFAFGLCRASSAALFAAALLRSASLLVAVVVPVPVADAAAAPPLLLPPPTPFASACGRVFDPADGRPYTDDDGPPGGCFPVSL